MNSSFPPGDANSSSYVGANSTPFSPSMAIILVVLLSAFFFMGFFSIYVKRCTGGDEAFNSAAAADATATGAAGLGSRQSAAVAQGLDPALLQALPLVAYSSSSKRRGGYNVECVVCLAEFEENEPLRQLPRCKHVFHQDCIDMWLYSHTTCPLCRRTVAGDGNSSWWGSNANAGGSGSIRLGLFGSRRSGGAVTPPPEGGSSRGRRAEVVDVDHVALTVLEERGSGPAASEQAIGGRNRWFRRSNSTGHSLIPVRQLRSNTPPPMARFVDTPDEGDDPRLPSTDILQRSRSEADGRRRQRQPPAAASLVTGSGDGRRRPAGSAITYRAAAVALGSPLSMVHHRPPSPLSVQGGLELQPNSQLEEEDEQEGAMGCGLLRSLSRQGGGGEREPFSSADAAHAFRRLS